MASDLLILAALAKTLWDLAKDRLTRWVIIAAAALLLGTYLSYRHFGYQ